MKRISSTGLTLQNLCLEAQRRPRQVEQQKYGHTSKLEEAETSQKFHRDAHILPKNYEEYCRHHKW
jgi:hypothetical protein